jgi:hypothetical protein
LILHESASYPLAPKSRRTDAVEDEVCVGNVANLLRSTGRNDDDIDWVDQLWSKIPEFHLPASSDD